MGMANDCKVTIGIPFRNNQSTLGSAIQSVFSQTYDNWRLILLDDGSSDNSYDIAGSIRDLRVAVYRNERNQGLGASLNRIAQLASTEYLVRMDADDLMHPDRIEKQLAWLEENRSVDVIGSSVYVMDKHNVLTGKRGAKPLVLKLDAIVKNGLMLHPTVFGRTTWFRKNPYNEHLERAQDLDLWCRTFRSSVFDTLAEPLLFYREDSSEKHLNQYIAGSRMVRRIIRTYGPKELGWLKMQKYILMSYLKSIFHSVLAIVGLRKRLIDLRSSPIDEKEARGARQTIDAIFRTPVPGMV
jgi:glycosyltransferase involved in cell wall biosynthesis